MAENTINVKVKQRTDTESNWASKNPVLLKGEMAISSDKNNKYKIGDGTSAWSVLSYAKADLSKSDVTTALGYTPPTTNTTYNDVTQSAHGLMTAADKKKLDGIASGATKVTVDSTLSSTSTNPVQNKVINSALTEKSNKNHTHDLSTMINTLSTGTATPIDDDYYISQYSGGGTTTTTYHRRPVKALFEYIKGKLSKVAVSGSYNDLSNKPAIPTVGNGTVTIKQAGTSKGTFSMNQSGNTTIELTDNNSWRGIQNNLTSTSTTDSLSANQGKILNESKLMHKTINTSKTDLNTLTETGIYHIVITDALNAPASNHGTLYVDTTVGTKYQVFMSDNVTNYMHKRYYDNTNKKWLGWTQLKLTDTVYTHPSHTAKSNGLYKITVDSTGHVSGTTAVTKSDITALGIPSTNTTYLTGTSSTSGLTKLYTGTGTATDGTMTQAAIKSSLDGKSDSSHTHTIANITNLQSTLDGKAAFNHTHSQYLTSHQDISGKLDNSATGADSLLSKITTSFTAIPTDDTYFIRQDTAGGSTFGRVKFSTLWSYIKGKTDSIYAKVSHKHTKSEITDFPTSMPANGGNASTVNGHTVKLDVPENAKFTDTNTWRGVQNNLTSTATDQSLSAYQGKVLKDLVDTKTTFTYSSTQPTSPASNAVWIG